MPPDLPKGIGPHEGCEFDLMRKGQKDVALFFELEPDGLTAMLEDGYCMLKFPQFRHDDKTYFTWVVFRKGFEGSAIRLKQLVQHSPPAFDASREHEIGRILSYSVEEIEAYILHVSKSAPV